ncbi:hypothetical protein [Eggerthella guodeyinii]|uniref:Uncharacterized protein n=1 Tax=Eggerthella guodeyinii TaxID=2690837 RepID=A0A6N7RI69_9ACTN|nr:hypothetical protein [Eggerthella guodeyinii]MRX81003.1 hypothetical protein [Eggerthella guodeyinii]
MIEPYFNAWLKARKAWLKKEPFGSVRNAWTNMVLLEKAVFATFVVFDAVLVVFGIIVSFDLVLLPVYGVCIAVFLVLYAGANRIMVLRDRRIPVWTMQVKAELIECMRKEFKDVGLANVEQVRLVKEESVRLLARKEHRHETLVHMVIEVIVLAGLVVVLNFLITAIEYDVPLESVGILAGAAATLSVALVLAVHLVWLAGEHWGPLPASQLRLFIDDLSRLLVEEAGKPSPRRAMRRRSLRAHRS